MIRPLKVIHSEHPKIERWPKIVGLLFDVHIPFHCHKSWELMLKVFDYARVNAIAIGGDFMDAYNISSYPKQAGIGKSFDQEVVAGQKALDDLQQFNCVIGYYEGNHEFRLVKNYPQLFGTLSWPQLLNFEKRKIQWIDFNPHQGHSLFESDLFIKHVPESEGKYPACHTGEKTGLSFITGHVHRFQSFYIKYFDRLIKCYSCGFMGDTKTGVFDYVKGFHKWHKGFAVATINENKSFNVDFVSVENDRCTFWGKEFK